MTAFWHPTARITLIEPGAVMTGLHDHITDGESQHKSTQSHEKVRSPQAQDVARAVVDAVPSLVAWPPT